MMTKVISFSSGKGGVGKTTWVSNLGLVWSAQGKRVLLVDGDWALGKLSITLGVRPQWTIDQVLAGQISLREAVSPIAPRLSLLASPSGILGFEELSEASRYQLYFEMEALRDEYDLILFDHSSGLNWGVLLFAAASHQHIIVTTPDPTSCTDAYAIMKILSMRFGIREFLLLVTMSTNPSQSEGSISRYSDVVRDKLGVRLNLIDIVPWEPKWLDSVRLQKPFVTLFPEHPLTRRIEKVSLIVDQHFLETKFVENSGVNFFYTQRGTTCPP